MDAEIKQKLPAWWIIILAPTGILLSSLFYGVFNNEIEYIFQSFGIHQSRVFALLVYNFATAIAVLLYYFLLRSKGLSFGHAGYRNKLTGKGILYGIGAFFIVSIILYPLIDSLLANFNIPMFWESIGETAIKQNTTQDIFLGILIPAILSPLTEDTIFRGYVFQMFSERMKVWMAIILSSLIFAVIHIGFFGPGLTVWVFFFGIASAYLYYKFDSIYPSLFYHFINNMWAYVIVPMLY